MSDNNLKIQVMSFGFKNGMVEDAELVFDVRFLDNPYYIEELKHKTGLDQVVYDYVMGLEEAGIFLDKLVDMLDFLIPNYRKKGKEHLTIAVGCTGGQHRSVTLARALYERLEKQGKYELAIVHRDID